MKINLKDIYSKMECWYTVFYLSDGKDNSYNELYKALRTLYSANLISQDTWNKITDYDAKLFLKHV